MHVGTTNKEERWYQATGINPNYYVSTKGRAVARLNRNLGGWPIYQLKPVADQHGRLYFKIRQPNKYYARVYIDEAIATGTAVVVPADLFDERQRAIEEAEAAEAEARAMRQREEARRLAMWALDYDEDHPPTMTTIISNFFAPLNGAQVNKKITMSKLSTTVKAEVPAAAIGKLYARLDNEATPHALRVKKGTREGVREIAISCQITSVDYFNKLVKSL